MSSIRPQEQQDQDDLVKMREQVLRQVVFVDNDNDAEGESFLAVEESTETSSGNNSNSTTSPPQPVAKLGGEGSEAQNASDSTLPPTPYSSSAVPNPQALQMEEHLPGAFRVTPSNGLTDSKMELPNDDGPVEDLNVGMAVEAAVPELQQEEVEENTIDAADDDGDAAAVVAYLNDMAVVEATLVMDDSSRFVQAMRRTLTEPSLVVEAAPMKDGSEGAGDGPRHSKNTKQQIILFGGFFLLLALAAIVLIPILLVLGANIDKGNNKEKDEVVYPPFRDNLHPSTVEHIQSPSTPQSRANAWVMEDPWFHEYSPERLLQRFSLACLFFSTDGEHWIRNDHWLDYDVDECDWYSAHYVRQDGPICNENGEYTHLNLTSNNLSGYMPLEFIFFTRMMFLDISFNEIYGSPPPMMGPLQNLQVAIISHNHMEGEYTTSVGFKNPNLRVFKNAHNEFRGKNPALYGLFPNLKELDSTGNQFTGTIPEDVVQMSHLQILRLGGNSYEGNLPTFLSGMTSLQELDVSETNIGGSIPEEFAALRNLTKLLLEDTFLTGKIPDGLCDLEEIRALNIVANCDEVVCCY